MAECRERALSLLGKAREDLYAATCLARDEEASLWTVGFHAQQAVEKSLKAVLMARGIRYPFTHDIAALLKLAHQDGLPLPCNSEEMPYLTPFGTLLRYEDEEWGLPATLEACHLLQPAEDAVAWARSLIEEVPKRNDET